MAPWVAHGCSLDCARLAAAWAHGVAAWAHGVAAWVHGVAGRGRGRRAAPAPPACPRGAAPPRRPARRCAYSADRSVRSSAAPGSWLGVGVGVGVG
eukprot:scaffold7551_cov33-Phaeocystis_antarctica.AAC.1